MKKILFLFLASVLTSCVATDRTVVVRNLSSKPLTELTLKTASDSFGFEFGTIIPKASKGYTGPMKVERRDVCELNWKDVAGKLHKADIDLSHEALSGFNGNLEFILNEDGKFVIKTRKD